MHQNKWNPGIVGFLLAVLLTGCAGQNVSQETERTSGWERPVSERPLLEGERLEMESAETAEPMPMTPIIQMKETDWSSYFDGSPGAAVIYDPTENRCRIYNQELASTQRSPCSTFKIISSLMALEHGIIDPEQSVRSWSGEVFWNDDWNRDIDFYDAFSTSCIWYFREVINELGAETVQTELDRLSYGNCDISDWEGRQNTNNSNRALTGFWVESSLKISPIEQAQVMERIFGSQSEYSVKTRETLEKAMRLSESVDSDIAIYGKTGMGKSAGVVVDAWFTGFADHNDRRVYFCVYLGQTEDAEVSSTKAKAIACRLISSEGFENDREY